MEKRKNFVINFLYFALILAILIVIFRYGIVWILPFVIGFGVAFLLKPLIKLLSEKLHFPPKLAAALLVLLFYATVGTLLSLLGIKLFTTIRDVFFELPNIYKVDVEPQLMELFNRVETWASKLDPTMMKGVEEFSNQAIASIGSNVSQLSVKAVEMVSGFATSIPGFLIQVLFSIISSFFIAMDYGILTGFVLRQLPERTRNLVFDIKDNIIGTLLKFLKSYSLIMSITFLELSLGLWIIGVKNFLLVALVIAIFDVLPVLGTGGVMIPWTLIELMNGNYTMALGLIVIYVIITIIRNILEPKIVGQQVGLHPIVTLMSMFLGVKIFGALGLFVLPISVVILKNLNDSGKIKVFK